MSVYPFPRGFGVAFFLAVLCVFPGSLVIATLFSNGGTCSLYDESINLALGSVLSLGAIPLAMFVVAAAVAYVVCVNAWLRGFKILTAGVIIVALAVGVLTSHHSGAGGCIQLP